MLNITRSLWKGWEGQEGNEVNLRAVRLVMSVCGHDLCFPSPLEEKLCGFEVRSD